MLELLLSDQVDLEALLYDFVCYGRLDMVEWLLGKGASRIAGISESRQNRRTSHKRYTPRFRSGPETFECGYCDESL